MSKPTHTAAKKVYSYVYPYVAPISRGAAEYVGEDGNDENGYRIIANQDFMGSVISIIEGDIVTTPAGAMVTTTLMDFQSDGPGHDAHVHATAGPELREALIKKWPNGGAATKCYVTEGFSLGYCNSVFHVVAPDYGPVLADETLAAQAELDLKLAYRNAMRAAMREQWQTMVFPLISVGDYQFPPKLAAKIALKAVRDVLAGEGLGQFARISIVLPEDDDSGSEKIYTDLFPEYFPEPPPAPPPTPPPQSDPVTGACGSNTKANTTCKRLVIRIDGQPPFCPQHMPKPPPAAAVVPKIEVDDEEGVVYKRICGERKQNGELCQRLVNRTNGFPRGCWQH
ncbi:macro domain-like protein [Acephala macrosclerotiorum]|nr:macro domain-like protein [Acephala macrosclerotiorum]